MNHIVKWLPVALLGLAFQQTPPGKLTPVRLSAAQVPAALKPPGKVLEAWRWQDVNGENTLIVTRTPMLPEIKTRNMDEEWYTELYVRQFVRTGNSYRELWRLYDANRNCWGDLELGPLAGATSITDLDKDGHTETTLVYKRSCRTDVSPAAMKLIMHEDAVKYALRGQMIQLANYPTKKEKANMQARAVCCADQLNPKTKDVYLQREGLVENEKEFATAPLAFLRFARQQWQQWRTKDQFEPLSQ